jgi:hypothetical protein
MNRTRLFTRKTGSGLPSPRNSRAFSGEPEMPTETTLARWGAWIRTRGWRNQNPTNSFGRSKYILKNFLIAAPYRSMA